MIINDYFIDLLNEKSGNNSLLSIEVDKRIAKKLVERIDQIKLYIHSYALTLNFSYGGFSVIDLMDIAYEESLSGVDIHIEFGKEKSLLKQSDDELRKIKVRADRMGLKFALEFSSTYREEVDAMVRIAKILHPEIIRVYIRYGGCLSEIIRKGIKDLKYIAQVAEENDLYFVLEQHEVLKGKEVVEIIREVNSPRMQLLFDFGNMINSNEDPLEVLDIMTPHIRQVHMKGSKRVKKRGGYKHVGLLSGEDDLPQARMLFSLLMLGDDEPQVKLFALEQEVGYVSPPFRFDNESNNPVIPDREPSKTHIGKDESIDNVLSEERRNAHKHAQYIRDLLSRMKLLMELLLEQ